MNDVINPEIVLFSKLSEASWQFKIIITIEDYASCKLT